MMARLGLILLLVAQSLPGWVCASACASRASCPPEASCAIVLADSPDRCCACVLPPSSASPDPGCGACPGECSDCSLICAQFTLPPLNIEVRPLELSQVMPPAQLAQWPVIPTIPHTRAPASRFQGPTWPPWIPRRPALCIWTI